MASQYSSNAGWCSPWVGMAWSLLPPVRRPGCQDLAAVCRKRCPDGRRSIRHTGAMVASLIARGVTVAQGPSLVLADVDLTVAPGQRIGLVGPNGVGKTTLLGALAGRVALEAGSVEQAPPDSVVGLLPQEPERSRGRVGARLSRSTCGHHRRRGASRVGHRRTRRGGGGQRRRLQHRVRPVDGPRRGRLRRPCRRRVGRPRAGTGVDRSADECALGRRGGAGLSRLAAAVEVRRVPPRRADQRPRPRRSRPARAVGDRPARRRGGGQPRPDVPRTCGHRRGRDRLPHPSGAAVRRRLVGLPRRT